MNLSNLISNFLYRPIGLYNKSYGFMIEHLDRNIGNKEFSFDGYSTPIGELCNPFYNTIVKTPWFIIDQDKMSYSNYIEYIKGVYGASNSVTNINDGVSIIDVKDTVIGYIDGSGIDDALNSNDENVIITNPNISGIDTMLGRKSSVFVRDTISNAIVENDKRNKMNFSVSSAMNEYFGINTTSFTNGILRISDKIDKETGRYYDLSPLTDVPSPVDTSNYGNYKTIGVYQHFYDSTPEGTTRKYIDDNVGRNKYKPVDDNDYFSSVGINVGNESIGSSQARYIFSTNDSHRTLDLNGSLWSFAEPEGGTVNDISGGFNPGIKYGYVSSYGSGTLSSNDLLKKTNDNFRADKYKTLIARFHTKSTDVDNNDITQTAISKQYGMSMGRNLLKKTPDKSEGYDNPYCRVWTFHHQYHRLSDAIRPLSDDGSIMTQEELENSHNFSTFRTKDTGLGSGGKRLDKYGSMHSSPNGLVNISPVKDGVNDIPIKNCMFSIENLAWKGVYGEGRLSDEQRGPFGGRIMWFPPYDLKFSESVNVNWNQTQFIGRGEDIYTYTNTSREGSLSFKLLIDHPSVLDYWTGKNQNEMSSNVDDIDSPEQELLRFFAGCDMLTAKSTQIKTDNQTDEDSSEPKPGTNVVTFMVFYPNDYSGQNDTGNNASDSLVPMTYLVNGVGAMKKANQQDYSLPLVKLYSDSNKTSQIGGYEVRKGTGVSVVKSTDASSNYITDVWVDGSSTKLSLGKQVGANRKASKWCYRVDKLRENEVLDDDDYVDKQSFMLNSGGQRDKICSVYGIDSDSLYSFTDIYVALSDSNAADVLSGLYDNTRVEAFKYMLNTYKIDKVECRGFASSHGSTPNDNVNVTRNNTLISNRAASVRNWLRNCNKMKSCGEWPAPETGSVGGPGSKTGDASELNAKIYRAARVDIYFQIENTKTVQNTLTEKGYKNQALSDSFQQTDVLVGSLNEYDKNWQKFKSANNNVNQQSDGTNVKDTYKRLLSENGTVIPDNTDILANSNIDYVVNLQDADNTERYGSVSGDNDTFEDIKALRKRKDANTEAGEYHRYDDEAEFFRLLAVNDPFMHHKLSDKIKYFDPAFHSVSPEGFNARLTFLHQCTRQGPTVGGSDEIVKSADNLSFGRQPVCILRVGDFYYTKIIIKSITINYDPLLWDLNTEGIGVMPMIADIQFNFAFIGGSDLSGPISRLQNALSFNYYANTEVYDDRSEQVEYNNDKSGTINKIKLFP